MDILFLDFETKDRGIDAGLGAGWPYNNLVDVIGYSYALGDAPVRWSTCHNKLKALVESVEAIACHNASYDVGILIMLGIDISQVLIYDTLIMAKLYDNSYLSYSLNKLSEKFFNEVKLEEKFKDIAVELKLVKSKTMDPVKYCKINLDKVYAAYPDVVIDYANQDVELLRKLFYKFTTDSEFFQDHDWTFYSDLLKSVLDIRKRGVRIDINQLFKSKELLEADLFSVNNKLSRYLQGRNPNSTVQLAQVCDELNVLYPVTDKGNPSITKAWLDQQDGEFFELLKSYKKMTKLLNDFINKTIDSLKFLNNVESDEDLKVVKFGRLHPEINIMGATATGRMSSSNPNFQQLPKRDPYAKPLVRSIVVPEEGELWYCADFSAQEPRLQVHYAARIGSAAGVDMAKKWNDNPDYDMHTEVANLCGIGRSHAKTINLGLCLDGSTIIETARGDVKLSDLVVGDLVFTSQGNYREVLQKFHRQAEAWRIITSTGKELISSQEHHVLVTKPQGGGKKRSYEYIPVGDLKVGMYLTPNILERAAGAGVLGILEAHALGFWLAEGHYNKHDYQMQACQKVGEYAALLGDVFKHIGIRALNPDKSGKVLFRYPKELRDKYLSIGLDISQKARGKYIPRADYSKDEIRHILCGLFEGDGCICVGDRNRVTIQYTTTSEQLANDVVFYLQKLGITAKIFKTARYLTNGIINVHVVGNISKRLFMLRIPTYKNVDVMGRLSTTVERIVRIDPVGVRDLYDIEVDVDHNFTANGLIVHNSYGMGLGKLSKSLQLSTKEAGLLVKKYHAGAPYLKDLTEATKNQLSKNLYIKTLLGRKLRKDSDLVDDNGQIQDFLYKAINKLVQGGAADQTMVALVMCYRVGIKINFPVHDEVTISAATLEEALKLKYIMENCVRLLVPSKSELTVGPSFANQEPVELSDYTQGITDFTATFKPLLNFS